LILRVFDDEEEDNHKNKRREIDEENDALSDAYLKFRMERGFS
jgi:hypothetical protein